jgi:Cu(I)/Ag(I) efflux system membrane fusion protein
MVYMYSPELFQAQEALLAADRAYQKIRGSSASKLSVEMQQATVSALEQGLRLWGLTQDQIVEIRERGTASDHMTVLSPITGIVTGMKALEGDYVKVGTKIYEVADLSRLWVYLDAYESDLAWVKYAQEVEFEAEAFPGEIFRGRISFIDPFLNEMTRTVKVRVIVDNADGRLKPGMFVRAQIHALLAAGGRIVEPSLAGKWVSPVHPEVVKDAPGECPVCGTPLVSAESLGYVGEDETPPLVIPATAPLLTGKRAVVYVEVPGSDRPTYEGREVLLGPRTQSDYLVRKGLEEGERVVVSGNFKIDSALQILARPSMMSPTEEAEVREPVDVPNEFRVSLSPLYLAYLDAQRALAGDDLSKAKTALPKVLWAAEGVDTRRSTGRVREIWMKLRPHLVGHAREGAEAADIVTARAAFGPLSKAVLETVAAFGQVTGRTLHEAFCPMAFENRGAPWLQEGDEIRNPYFGASMLACGEIRATFQSREESVVPEEFRKEISSLLEPYLAVAEALASDDIETARRSVAVLGEALGAVRATSLKAEQRGLWRRASGSLRNALESIGNATNLEEARRPFALLSDQTIKLLRRFGHAGPDDLVEVHCPMAFANRGADWIQRGETIRNPFFGSAMLRCGDVIRRLARQPGD